MIYGIMRYKWNNPIYINNPITYKDTPFEYVIHRENEILFPPHQIMQYFLWFKFNQAVLCHSSINPKQRRSDVRMKYTSSQVNCFDYANCVWLRQSNCFWGCYCTECTASWVCMNEQRSLFQQRFHEEEKGAYYFIINKHAQMD